MFVSLNKKEVLMVVHFVGLPCHYFVGAALHFNRGCSPWIGESVWAIHQRQVLIRQLALRGFSQGQAAHIALREFKRFWLSYADFLL